MVMDVGQMFVNFESTGQVLITTVKYVSAIIGIVMMGMAALKFKEVGDGRMKVSTPIFYMLLSGALFSLPGMLNVASQTIFAHNALNGSVDLSMLPASATSGGAEATKVLKAVLLFIKLIGNIAFVRGLLLLKQAADGKEQTVGRGLMHILGGAMAVNIEMTYDMVSKMFMGG